MLEAFFNPYPGISENYETGKEIILQTAKSYRKIDNEIKLRAYDPEGSDSIRCFIVSQDNHGAKFTPSSYIRNYRGSDRDLVIWFFTMFDRGVKLYTEDLAICKDWTLCQLDVPAPLLEYASRMDGVAVTISDDQDWKVDFFNFNENHNQLPNVHGQENCDPLVDWIKEWTERNLSFMSLLEERFNVIFCRGSINNCFPSKHEEKGIISSFDRAIENNYQIDGNLIKCFSTKYGNILEMRSYGDGVRIFFTMKNDNPLIGGFYRKSASISQNKSATYAAKRLKDEGYL